MRARRVEMLFGVLFAGWAWWRNGRAARRRPEPSDGPWVVEADLIDYPDDTLIDTLIDQVAAELDDDLNATVLGWPNAGEREPSEGFMRGERPQR